MRSRDVFTKPLRFEKLDDRDLPSITVGEFTAPFSMADSTPAKESYPHDEVEEIAQKLMASGKSPDEFLPRDEIAAIASSFPDERLSRSDFARLLAERIINISNGAMTEQRPAIHSRFDEDDLRMEVRIELPVHERIVANPVEFLGAKGQQVPAPVKPTAEVHANVESVKEWATNVNVADPKLAYPKGEDLRTATTLEVSLREDVGELIIPPIVDVSDMIQPVQPVVDSQPVVNAVASAAATATAVGVNVVNQALLTGAVAIDLQALERNAEDFLVHVSHLSVDLSRTVSWSKLAWMSAGALLTGGVVHAALSNRKRFRSLSNVYPVELIVLNNGTSQ